MSIRDTRRLVDHFWTGKGWSRRLRDARLYHDPDDVARTIDRLTRRHLRRHQPKRLYLLTARRPGPRRRVRLPAGDVEKYLQDALVVGVDHERYGTGPTPDSLVEVMLPRLLAWKRAADMDLGAKVVAGLFVVWAVAMAVGLLIALAPAILFVVGFVLMVVVVTFVGRLVGSWFLY